MPDRVFKIHTSEEHIYYSDGDETQYFDVSDLIAINWHDKTEITRPIQEATEQDLGKLCKFWDYEEFFYFGILNKIEVDGKEKLYRYRGGAFSHCCRLTKTEVSELC